MIFLVNPKKGRRMARKKARTPAQCRATAKLVAFNEQRRKTRRVVKRKTRRKSARKSVRKPARRQATVKRRTTRRRPVRRKTVRRRRSTIRRNPPKFSAKGILKQVQQGAIDAAGVVVGKAATRIVANLVPINKEGMLMNFVVQAGSALVVGIAAGMVVSRDMARMVIAGGFAAPIEGFAKGIPFIGPMLGDDYLELGEYEVGEYAMGDADPFLPIGDADPFLPIGEGEGEEEFAEIGEYAYG